MNRDCSDGIIDFEHTFYELHTYANQHAGDQADDRGPHRAYETAGGSNGDQPREQTVTGHGRVRLSVTNPHVQDRSERARATRQHGVDGNRPDAQRSVARGSESASRIEPKPAEGQDEATGEHDNDVMARHRIGCAVAVVLADPRPNNHGKG